MPRKKVQINPETPLTSEEWDTIATVLMETAYTDFREGRTVRANERRNIAVKATLRARPGSPVRQAITEAPAPTPAKGAKPASK